VVAVYPPYTYDGHMLSVFFPLATLNKSSSPFTSKCAPRAHHQPSHSASAVDTPPPYPHSNDNIAIIGRQCEQSYFFLARFTSPVVDAQIAIARTLNHHAVVTYCVKNTNVKSI